MLVLRKLEFDFGPLSSCSPSMYMVWVGEGERCRLVGAWGMECLTSAIKHSAKALRALSLFRRRGLMKIYHDEIGIKVVLCSFRIHFIAIHADSKFNRQCRS